MFGRSPVVISFIANIFLPSLSSGTGGKICKRKEVGYAKRAFDCVRRVGRLLGGKYEERMEMASACGVNFLAVLGGSNRHKLELCDIAIEFCRLLWGCSRLLIFKLYFINIELRLF